MLENYFPYKVKEQKIVKTRTDCCAFGQLSRMNNLTSEEQLDRVLAEQRLGMLRNNEVGVSHGHGQTSFFTVISPGEDKLEALLIKKGFKYVNTFKRRVGYPDGMLKMYIINF